MSNPEPTTSDSDQSLPQHTELPGRRVIPLRPSALSKPNPTSPRLHLPGQKRTPLPAPSGQYRDFYIKPGQNGQNEPGRIKQRHYKNMHSLLHGRVLATLGILVAIAISMAVYAMLRSSTTPAPSPSSTESGEN